MAHRKLILICIILLFKNAIKFGAFYLKLSNFGRYAILYTIVYLIYVNCMTLKLSVLRVNSFSYFSGNVMTKKTTPAPIKLDDRNFHLVPEKEFWVGFEGRKVKPL